MPGHGARTASQSITPDPAPIESSLCQEVLHEARFWLGAADQLAAAGNQASAKQATSEANYYLGLAEGALGDMSEAC